MAAASFFGSDDAEGEPLLSSSIPDESDNEAGPLLPVFNPQIQLYGKLPPTAVTMCCTRIKFLVEEAIPYDVKKSRILQTNSPVITKEVLRLVHESMPGDDKGCLVFCLITCMKWFEEQAMDDLSDTNLCLTRGFACENIAVRLMDEAAHTANFENVLMHGFLLRRFSIIRKGKESVRRNALELAVDQHSLGIISSFGYQKTMQYLWKGWIIQDPNDGNSFVSYSKVAEPGFWNHFNPERLRAPMYQSAVQIFISFVFLGLYTIAINTMNPGGELDFIEGLLYIFTLGYIVDEAIKFWKVGTSYFGFWNVFNMSLYSIVTSSFVIRLIALAYEPDSHTRYKHQVLSYNILAASAPMFWMRMVLYLDNFEYWGTMLLVLKKMMTESLTFFSLLTVVIVGFLQGFVGMDNTENEGDATTFIVRTMISTILGGPDLTSFDHFAYPFGMILYHFFTFIVIVILLNILIALYSTAYADVTANQTDEYMALSALKTLQYVRAPDENVFIPPFNLVEIFGLILPFEWWMPKATYAKLNDFVMSICYLPFMLIIANIDNRTAAEVAANRKMGQLDDDEVEEWELYEEALTEWTRVLKDSQIRKGVESDPSVDAVEKLRKEFSETISQLQMKIETLTAATAAAQNTSSGSDTDN